MNRGVYRVFLLAVCLIAGCSRQRNSVLAVVDGETVTADQFRERFTKYRKMTGEQDNIVVRKKILANMVNELLIMHDVRRKGIDADSAASERLRDIRDQALLDVYAKTLTTDTLTVTERDLWDEFRSFNTKLGLRYVYAKTEKEAWALRTRIQSGESFQSVAKDAFEDPDLQRSGGYLGFVGYGDLEPALQHAAFALQVGELSNPVRIKLGYGIVKLEKRVAVPLASEIDFAKKKPEMEQAIRNRKAVEYLDGEIDRIDSTLHPVYDAEAVGHVLKNWEFVVNQPASRGAEEPRNTSWQDVSAMRLVRFKNTLWTIGDFLQRAEKSRARDRKRVKTEEDVRNFVSGLAIREVLLNKADQLSLESDPRVKAQVKRVWEDYQLNRWRTAVEDTVGKTGWDEAELRREFEANKDIYAERPQADVAEILVRDSAEAKILTDALKKGADFGALARKNSVRIWAAKKGGDLGFAPKEDFGKFGDEVFSAKIGQILGPIVVRPYFGVYKVLALNRGGTRTFSKRGAW
jgi:parvulin-like peptidyl-prolyl isomerase